MPTVNPSPFGPKPQFELADGLPAVGNKLFFYVAGSVNTKQDTYTDSTGSVANANPLILNSLGFPTTEIWFQAGLAYKVVYAPSTDTDPPTSPIWTIDHLLGINDTTSSQSEWVASGLTPTFIGATSFSLVGDQTSTFTVGRRVKTTNSGGTIYSRISASVFGALTTITVVNDSGVLDSGLSAVSYGLLSSTNVSLPVFGVIPQGNFRAVIATFAANGTVVVPTGMTTLYATGAAPGGGGGGANNAAASSAGGGGAGQGTILQPLTVVPGETLTIVCPSSGGAGGVGNANGAAGSNLTVTGSTSGLLLTLVAGAGGALGNGSNGNGGAAGGALANVGMTGVGGSLLSGSGGASIFGSGGFIVSQSAGIAGILYGSGGSGASSNGGGATNGGAGAGGFLILQ